jgi:hypothetical protein
VAFKQELPFQEGKPLSRISVEGEGSTELVEYIHTAESSPDRQVYIGSLCNTDDDEPGPKYDAELLAKVSANERTAHAPLGENEEYKRIRWLKNTKCAKHRRNMENCALNPLNKRNLNNAYAAAEDREYRTLIGATAEAALLAEQLPSNSQIQRLQYLTQRALVQLDGQNPMFSNRNVLSRSECHGDSESTQVSRLPRGGFGYWGNNNR